MIVSATRLGLLLRTLRIARGLSVEDLAALSGVGGGTIAAAEACGPLTACACIDLARALHLERALSADQQALVMRLVDEDAGGAPA